MFLFSLGDGRPGREPKTKYIQALSPFINSIFSIVFQFSKQTNKKKNEYVGGTDNLDGRLRLSKAFFHSPREPYIQLVQLSVW
jgi:hypothetical protein